MKKSKLRSNFLQAGLVLALVAIFIIIIALFPAADNTAKLNPELAHMKYPVLVLAILLFVPIIYAILQAFRLLVMIRQQMVFVRSTVWLLKQMGWAFQVGALVMTILLIYTYINIPNAIEIIWMAGGIILFLMGGCFFHLLSDLFLNAVQIKEEQDLTI